jgi:uncharacterized membrane protein YfcA
MNATEVVVLLTAGFAVGFINTIAGGATVISFAAMMVLGLPITMANATHRVAAAFQTLASSGAFLRQKILDYKTGLRLGIPTTIGSVFGAWASVDIHEETFRIIAGVAMLLMLVAMLVKPGIWMMGKRTEPRVKPKPWHYLVFFAVGFYGGFIYIGIGYFLLAALVLTTGLDLLRSNALKVFIVMLYVPFTLVPFILADLIHWPFALVLSIGQAAGAWIAARASISLGNGFIRWFMIVFILILVADLFGIFSLQSLFNMAG